MTLVETIDRIETLANQQLEKLKDLNGKIAFPIDPFKLLKIHNVIITFSDFDKLEGLLLYDKIKSSVVAINAKRPIQRQRFTAAHELGHIILHSSKEEFNFICPKNSKKNIEKEADTFASNLLMPTYELNKLVDKYMDENGNVGLNECLFIAEYFGVSFESCVKTIRFRLQRFIEKIDNEELTKLIKRFKPSLKRKELLMSINDLFLLKNAIDYSYFSILENNKITGIKFLQNLVYHDNRLENVDVSIEKVIEVFADLRIHGSNSSFCVESNRIIIEVMGNIEMNTYCLETDENVDVFKTKKLHQLLYKYSPFPEYAGNFKTNSNIIYGGSKQQISVDKMFDKLEEMNKKIIDLAYNVDKYTISEYIEKACIIHYDMTILHPFDDGNGRVSRGLLNWILRLKNLPPIYIDYSRKKEYLCALNKIDDQGDTIDLQVIVIRAMLEIMMSIHKSWM